MKKCVCLIRTFGAIRGKSNRKQTGKVLGRSSGLASTWESTSWHDEVFALPLPCPAPALKATIEDAVEAFLSDRKDTSSFNTQRKSRYLLNSLKRYSEFKGYTFVEQ